ncbi:hypothetical protein [Frankia sp. ACN1ag]|uniref:hypothetical protein n=1 Tax=Frankia sp. ACN1ag TaxID=102891 RepID=UPI0006DCD879|nr:hypothetical protein [Frankia sp. ACN1ag]KQC39254.1 hypothetical protein UK82_06340 [Frankia sp. ACN1ag]
MAADLGYGVQHVCTMLAGRSRTSVPFRRAVAEYLGMPEAELFHDDVTQWRESLAAVLAAAPPAARRHAARVSALLDVEQGAA